MKQKIQHTTFLKINMFKKIFILFAGSLTFLLVVYGLFSFPVQKKSLIEVMHSEARALSNFVSMYSSEAIINEDYSFVVEHTMSVIKNNPRILTITISKIDGLIVKSKEESWEMLETLPSPIVLFEQKKEVYKIIYSEALKQNVFHYSMPLFVSGVHLGWIHVEYSLDTYQASINHMYLFLTYLTLGSMLIIFLVSYYLAQYILSPILALKKVAKEVSRGNLSVRADIQRTDEIGNFTKDFNLMIVNLEKSKEALNHSHAVLEERVNERTAELSEKSTELAQLNKTLDHRVKVESRKLQENEQLLIQQSRQAAMGEMIGNIAHQWRQPLNTLGLVLQNIHFEYQMGTLTDEFMENSVSKGKKLTQSMSKTIDDFRNFFKPNKLKETYKISDVIKNTIELLEESFKNHNIEIEKDLDYNIEHLGYPSEFSQVILNILSNAKDALIENEVAHKMVKIDTSLNGEMIEIKISDNAGGIPEQIIEKIFEPYFTTKEEGKGTGIGLYMSSTIIEKNMLGKLNVHNDELGAVFTITLPLEDKNDNIARKE